MLKFIFGEAKIVTHLWNTVMIPLRHSLVVKEHGNPPYPEGTACASVLLSAEKKESGLKEKAVDV